MPEQPNPDAETELDTAEAPEALSAAEDPAPTDHPAGDGDGHGDGDGDGEPAGDNQPAGDDANDGNDGNEQPDAAAEDDDDDDEEEEEEEEEKGAAFGGRTDGNVGLDLGLAPVGLSSSFTSDDDAPDGLADNSGGRVKQVTVKMPTPEESKETPFQRQMREAAEARAQKDGKVIKAKEDLEAKAKPKEPEPKPSATVEAIKARLAGAPPGLLDAAQPTPPSGEKTTADLLREKIGGGQGSKPESQKSTADKLREQLGA